MDDNRDSLEMLAAFLSMAGFCVTAVDSAIDAVTLNFDNIFAVVTDLSMPGMDGFEFVRWLHQMHAHRRISIIAVTGQTVASTAALQRELGCCRVFVKPCDLDELAKTLDGLLAAA
ncbi:MAG: response regulator [Bacteroidales bacterium]